MISIVIPIYNEEENIGHLHERLLSASPSWEEEFEVIFVDDGSHDRSLEMLKGISKDDQRFKTLKLSRNFGHQAAISAGIQKASGDAVVIMDGDLQDPPEELNRFLKKWREGYHVVYAIRKNRKESFFKKLAYNAFYRLLDLISDIKIPLDSGDFCVMDRAVVNVLVHELPERMRFVRGLRAYAGFTQIGVEYDRARRAAGEAKYTFGKLLQLAVDGLLDFSIFPLRLASYLGFSISILSFFAAIFFVFHRIIGFKIFGYSPAEVPGLASLALGVFFIGGITLMVLGIIGEYLGRIYFEVKKRPTYVIEHFYNQNESDAK